MYALKVVYTRSQVCGYPTSDGLRVYKEIDKHCPAPRTGKIDYKESFDMQEMHDMSKTQREVSQAMHVNCTVPHSDS